MARLTQKIFFSFFADDAFATSIDNDEDLLPFPKKEPSAAESSPTTHHPNSVLPNFEELEPFKKPTTSLAPFHNKDDSSSEPYFVSEPENGYIIKGKSAELTCSVRHADKAYFSCNGEAMAESPMHRERDAVEAVEAAEASTSEAAVTTTKHLTLEVTRNMVEEFFGRFKCRCDAWSSKGRLTSKEVSVQTACELCVIIKSPFCALLSLRVGNTRNGRAGERREG